jgi:transcriptional regulator with XRE-family HTH domain
MGDEAPISSTVRAWELGLRLREHRERLGFTAAAVGRTTGIGGTNLSAIESGKRRLTAAKLGDLADAYELADDERAGLEALRAQTERREWWYDYARLYSDDFLRLLGLEAGADKVFEYAPDIIPGLLQTADYARAVVRAGTPYIRPVDVGPRLETRLRGRAAWPATTRCGSTSCWARPRCGNSSATPVSCGGNWRTCWTSSTARVVTCGCGSCPSGRGRTRCSARR